ncbi:hypothetical protein A2U01_0086272, partial [Trifolium medium]|nr:hypothetical protein [Trifolium medium]
MSVFSSLTTSAIQFDERPLAFSTRFKDMT